LMRPFEAITILLSPLFFLVQMGLRFRDWSNRQTKG
jgi:hypothetical protein